ncbi:hypothetical protein CYLTODRAFT_495027 [Cylindrobasidium torrendii FP15055 ss-10]|uniref:Uncharacterized protein n=1 Tax=Cylindrobasidium torrendii FP15055 ss-10 TaxID=1314674 RepID=A0A0D7AX08_9AGAR|nr:hypothetical protein CYLTODRAFT_495027 [Cylindrobasidium torrendii FP15055 ss-10]
MVFTKSKGRPRRHATVALAKEAIRENKQRYEHQHKERRTAQRKERRKGRREELASRRPSMHWTPPTYSLLELQDNAYSGFPTPEDPTLATLYCRLRCIYMQITDSLDGDAEKWFSALVEVIQYSRGEALYSHMMMLESVLRALEPYFRAMAVTYDTYAIFFRKAPENWATEVSDMAAAVHMWKDRIRTVLDAYAMGAGHLRLHVLNGHI